MTSSRVLTLLAFVVTVVAVESCGDSPGSPGGGGGGGTNAVVRFVATTGNDSGNDCKAQSNPCATIQFAHNVALPDEVVQVAPGLFTGPVTISKRITLLGAGKGQTIIRAPMVVNLTNTAGTTALRIQQLTVTNNDPATHGLSISMNAGITHSVRVVEITGSMRHGLNVSGTSGSLDIAFSEMVANADDGIHIEGNVDVLMSDVQFNLNGGDGLQFSGVTGLLDGVRLTARFNGQAGIQVETMPSGRLTVRDSCIVQNGSQSGITLSLIANPATILVERSNIFLNSSGGAEAMGVNVNPDLRNNWWGAANGPGNAGPGAGNGVTAGIQFSPWSTVPFVLSPAC